MRRRLVHSLFAFAVAVALIAVPATPAHADEFGYWDGGLYILGLKCGGTKINVDPPNNNWWTVGWGGYDAHTCGPTIDVHTTPTGYNPGSGAARSFYDFGQNFYPTSGFMTIQAWIPWDYANAVMDFTVEIYQTCGGSAHWAWNYTVNEALYSGWQSIGYVQTGLYCYRVYVTGWSGMVTSGYYLGLDAIRVVDEF